MNKKITFLLACAAFLLVQATCVRPAQSPSGPVLSRFPELSNMPDTLHGFLSDSTAGIALSDTLLKSALDSAQFASLHFDTGEAQFLALGQFPFAHGLRAALLRTEEFWFGKLSLLIFDPKQQKCLYVAELSHFYGGDGGQTASESWLFAGPAPRLFVKTADHGFTPPKESDTEPQEYLHESGQLFAWAATRFQPVQNPDSLLFLQKFRMHRAW
ncbi:MAG: hypothetical protein J0L99_07410 [Chitinophagales bacterium]|nr:hypothetical protein [Chitinophagales bacterium]